jgi:CobQ-like glutamine amidotransferase family enzyme
VRGGAVSSVHVCHLYPGELNIYADRGNIAVLRRRLEWRGHELRVTEAGIGSPIPDDADLYYLGGGQDRDQMIVAADLALTKADALHRAVDGGAVMLAVCGGYQLAGHGYTGTDGVRMPGIGILDADTVAGPTRLIGDLVITVELGGGPITVVGFENHAGRTDLGVGSRPFGRVVHGHGNNDLDGGEGAVSGRAIGTYLHGPLLPKNPALADLLLAWALEHATGRPVPLDPLDDTLEHEAHRAAIARISTRGAA